MDIDEIKRIIELMKENEICEFELEEDDFRIAVKRRDGNEPQVIMSAAPQLVIPQGAVSSAAATAPGTQTVEAAVAADADADAPAIRSPMVGTFYRAAAPDSDSFVSIGAEIDEDTVVCIIEAMKVMNEIKAETRGVIKKILVENATAVEFDEPLFLIEPA